MNYIVTGGAGFIGSHVVEELVKRGEKVTVIDNLITGKKENIKPFLKKIRLVEKSIEDQAILQKEFRNADVIIHLAALPSVPRSIKEPVLSDKLNINGTVCVFEEARKAGKKVVYASSSSVYGDLEVLPKKETHPNKPLSFYALQKLTDERYASLYNSIFGCDFIGLRFFNVFGPRQDPNSEYSAVIPKFIKIIKEGKTPTIYGDGKTSRDFTYVKNVVDAILLACSANTKSKVFNIATGTRISLNELISKIAKIEKKKISPNYEKEREGDIKHSLADISLAKKEIGFVPKYSFDEGLKETAKTL